MKKNLSTSITQASMVILFIGTFFSCRKSIDEIAPEQTGKDLVFLSATNASNDHRSIVSMTDVTRVYDTDISIDSADPWEELQINTGGTGPFVTTPHVGIESATLLRPGLNPGAAFLQLPKALDPDLRRLRLNNKQYHTTKLEDLTVLEYSTYILANANESGISIVLQIDTSGDGIRDFNIGFEPRVQLNQDVTINTWQNWDVLNGLWGIEGAPLPAGLNAAFTLKDFLRVQWNHPPRIVNTEQLGTGAIGGIRFTIGGPGSDFDNFKGYIDAFIIGLKGQSKPHLYDFVYED